MLIRIAAVLLAAVVLTPAPQVLAQPAPGYQGVAWQPPPDFAAAADDLRRIHATGFNAVRTGIVEDERLLVLADTLGLTVFQDLPLSFLPAARLVDTLAHAQAFLETVLLRSSRHASAQFFGLGHSLETDDVGCDALRRLVDHGREIASASVRFYYTTRMPGIEVCDAVDLVLLDGRDRADLTRMTTDWRSRHDTPVGFAAVGAWVGSSAGSGLVYPRSAESQARYLEDRLTELLRLDAPPAFFVYRWRDGRAAAPSVSRGEADPYLERYGLFSGDNEERPAYEVVRGLLTGEQAVFALDAGTGAHRPWPWTVLMGWLVIGGLAVLYAAAPRFRQLVPRYFRAHGFYRDAIREGRDLLLGSALAALVTVGLAAGVTASVVMGAVGDIVPVRILLAWLPPDVVEFLALSSYQPVVFILMVAGVYAAAMITWAIVIALCSRLHLSLRPGQALMLVIWPRWPLVLLMVAALTLAASPLETAADAWPLFIVVGLWLLVTLYATIRAIVDFTAISRVPLYAPVIAAVLNPFLVAAAIILLIALQYAPEVGFLLRIAAGF